jgi:cysteine desulfurase family protein (TIGR01976 family)
MTTLTMNISRALARTFQPGDTLVVTRLDHDANISPWLLAAEDRGCKVRWVDFDPAICTLKLAELEQILKEDKPRLVAVGYASNAVGTINPIPEIARMAHEAGALIYVDAVHYTPHAPIDVRATDVDFLVCSAYKFFGPHLGILYGKYELLENLKAYKVRPAPVEPPGKFETGTNNFENIAGLLGSLEYYEWLGRTMGEEYHEAVAPRYNGRKAVFKQALMAINHYEQGLSLALLKNLQPVNGLQIYGITDPDHFNQRVPTFSFTVEGFTPREIAEYLGKNGIYVWDGNFYALAVTERLGLEEKGGLLRVGAAHYNTQAEIERLGAALQRMTR